MGISIRAKLLALSSTAIILSLAQGGAALWNSEQLGGAIHGVSLTSKALRSHMEADMMHDALRSDVYAALVAQSPEEAKEAEDSLREHADHFRKMIEENDERDLDPKIHHALAEVRPLIEKYVSSALKVQEASLRSAEEARTLLPEFVESFEELEGRMGEASDLIEATAAAMDSSGARAEELAVQWTIACCAAMAGLMALLGFATAQSIVRPVRRVVERIRDIAEGEGDLRQRLEEDRSDELGELSSWFNRFVERLEHTIQNLNQSSQQIAGASAQVASGSREISEGAQAQASSLEETSANLSQMTATVKQNAENAQQASQLADGAREVAERGGKVVVSAVEAMGEINQSSKKIAEIISTIDEIAFQTNLLALNAAVEAARAGEQGRGFAVVATEVRGLAQRSAVAAREIKALIEDSVRKVENGSALVNRSGATLDEIIQSVKRVTDIVSEIASACREQATGIGELSNAVGQMDQVIQSNAAQTEELSATATALSQSGEDLRQLLAQFRVSGDEAYSAPEPAAAAAGNRQHASASRVARRKGAQRELVTSSASAGGFDEL